MHCDINEVVREHLDRSATVDLAEFVGQMTECLAELILLALEGERANMFAKRSGGWENRILRKLGLVEGDSAMAH